MPLIRITAPQSPEGGDGFIAGLVAGDGKVIEAAPIVQYMVGWNGAEVARYCRSKGWTWKRMDDADEPDA